MRETNQPYTHRKYISTRHLRSFGIVQTKFNSTHPHNNKTDTHSWICLSSCVCVRLFVGIIQHGHTYTIYSVRCCWAQQIYTRFCTLATTAQSSIGVCAIRVDERVQYIRVLHAMCIVFYFLFDWIEMVLVDGVLHILRLILHFNIYLGSITKAHIRAHAEQ